MSITFTLLNKIILKIKIKIKMRKLKRRLKRKNGKIPFSREKSEVYLLDTTERH